MISVVSVVQALNRERVISARASNLLSSGSMSVLGLKSLRVYGSVRYTPSSVCARERPT